MKNLKNKKAFSMIELIFVIVIIGILASVAIPKLAATRDDAFIAKARATVASVRSALSIERQKRILRGDFTPVIAVGNATNVFGVFSAASNGDTRDVLEYPIVSTVNTKDKWSFIAGGGRSGRDRYRFDSALGDVNFEVVGGKFQCDAINTLNTNATGCTQLTN